jgi:hypothetical protein
MEGGLGGRGGRPSVLWFAGDEDGVGVREAGGSIRRYHGIEDGN